MRILENIDRVIVALYLYNLTLRGHWNAIWMRHFQMHFPERKWCFDQISLLMLFIYAAGIGSHVIATWFCTWHDSCAAVACAKICSDLITSNRNSENLFPSISRFDWIFISDMSQVCKLAYLYQSGTHSNPSPGPVPLVHPTLVTDVTR